MDEERFEQLLQAHMFGRTSAAERRQLADAALESSERTLALVQAEEIRSHLEDPAFRRELIDVLPAVAPARREAWWRNWIRFDVVVPLCAGAALVVLALAIRDRWSTPPEVAIDRTHSFPTGQGPDTQVPLHANATGVGEAMQALFELPEDRTAGVPLSLSTDTPRAAERLRGSVNLAGSSWVYAIVRGPTGFFREVYPDGGADAPQQGAVSFEFPATDRMDPDVGRFTLRVFVVDGADASRPPRDAERWAWLQSTARFEEISYEVSP